MSDYVTNAEISIPLHIVGLEPDVDLNGMKFSYKHGIFYTPSSGPLPIKLPPPWDGGR